MAKINKAPTGTAIANRIKVAVTDGEEVFNSETSLSSIGGSALEVQDDGTSLTTAVTKLNFAGTGVTLSEPVADEITITISTSPTIASGEFCPGYAFTRVDNDSIITVLDVDIQTLFDGRRVRIADTTDKYGTVASTSYATGTTVNLTMEDSATIDANPTEVCLTSSTSNWVPISDTTISSVGTAINDLACGTVGASYYTVAVGDGGKIYYSTDNGVTWTAGTSGTVDDLHHIFYDSVNEQFICQHLSGSEDTRLFSTDGGVTWTAISTTSLGTNIFNARLVEDGTYIWTGTDVGTERLLLTQLAAGTWSASGASNDFQNRIAWFRWANGFNANFSSDGTNLQLRYATTLTGTDALSGTTRSFPSGNTITDQLEISGVASLLSGTGGHIFRTTDNLSPIGTDWVSGSTAFGSNDVNGFAFASALGASGTLVAVGANGVIAYSTDSGSTFSTTTNGFGATEDIKAVVYCDAPSNPVFIAASETGTICRSTNGIS